MPSKVICSFSLQHYSNGGGANLIRFLVLGDYMNHSFIRLFSASYTVICISEIQFKFSVYEGTSTLSKLGMMSRQNSCL